jgi:HPt (histidine-containing phosphotransfer) domain-containing protein
VDTFLQEAPPMLNDLRHALAAKDADKFRRTAHSLKSNSNTFGALTLGAMARELELSGVANVIESSGQPLDALAQEYSRVAAALTELRHA